MHFGIFQANLYICARTYTYYLLELGYKYVHVPIGTCTHLSPYSYSFSYRDNVLKAGLINTLIK